MGIKNRYWEHNNEEAVVDFLVVDDRRAHNLFFSPYAKLV
jgi:hypothetical protein